MTTHSTQRAVGRELLDGVRSQHLRGLQCPVSCCACALRGLRHGATQRTTDERLHQHRAANSGLDLLCAAHNRLSHASRGDRE